MRANILGIWPSGGTWDTQEWTELGNVVHGEYARVDRVRQCSTWKYAVKYAEWAKRKE